MIHCLMFAGIPLNDVIRDLLFDAAQEMFSKKQKYKKIKNTWCTGYIKTEWTISGMGATYGTVFNAYLETNLGITEVNYIAVYQKLKKEKTTWVSKRKTVFSEN